jgi:helix-turn-helix protein
MARVRTKSWKDVERKLFTPSEIAEATRYAEAEVLEMNLRELRQATGKTQTEVAAAANMRQGELSRAERRDDHLLSTLRRYVEGLGGELEIIARVNGKTVKLRGV